MILPSIWLFIGVGVAIAMHITVQQKHPAKYQGITAVAGFILFTLFWPIAVISILMLALIAIIADR